MPKKKGKKAGRDGVLAAPRPDAKVRDYDAHVLVCKGGDCKKRGSIASTASASASTARTPSSTPRGRGTSA